MKLLSERNQILSVANDWRNQYPHPPFTERDKIETQHKLDALDKSKATADEVAEIIGNTTWVKKPMCDECGNASWDAVQLGEPPDYESATAVICLDCLRKAVLLIDGDGN